MFSYDKRIKAVKRLIKNGMSYSVTARELGYPNRRTLELWYKEYKINGDLKQDFTKPEKYSEADKERAVDHYLKHGQNISYTTRCLGYPSRPLLREWIIAKVPSSKTQQQSGSPLKVYSMDQKSSIISDILLKNESVTATAKKYGVSRSAIYKWQRQTLPVEVLEEMRKKKHEKSADNQSIDELKEEHQKLREAHLKLQEEIRQLELEKDILVEVAKVIKKDEGISIETILLSNREKTIVANALTIKYSLTILLKILNLAKSSYFYQLKAIKRTGKDALLRANIRAIFRESFETYGYRRIHVKLAGRGIKVSEKVVRRIMKEEKLVVIHMRRKTYNSYKGDPSPAVENLLGRDFQADKPNEKWVTDISEFALASGKVYLSPILDCFDGMPVTWTIGTSPNASLASTMLKEAIGTLENGERPIVHSDQGGHYRWPDWIKIMEENELIRSMSKKACPPDNAACEGFFGLIKKEMFYGRSWVQTSVEEFMRYLDQYLHWFANERIKIGLGGLSPMEYRETMKATA